MLNSMINIQCSLLTFTEAAAILSCLALISARKSLPITCTPNWRPMRGLCLLFMSVCGSSLGSEVTSSSGGSGSLGIMTCSASDTVVRTGVFTGGLGGEGSSGSGLEAGGWGMVVEGVTGACWGLVGTSGAGWLFSDLEERGLMRLKRPLMRDSRFLSTSGWGWLLFCVRRLAGEEIKKVCKLVKYTTTDQIGWHGTLENHKKTKQNKSASSPDGGFVASLQTYLKLSLVTFLEKNSSIPSSTFTTAPFCSGSGVGQLLAVAWKAQFNSLIPPTITYHKYMYIFINALQYTVKLLLYYM